MKYFLRLFTVMLFLASISWANPNLIVNGDLETVMPNFWLPVNDGMGGASCVWDLENGFQSMRSFKIVKPNTTSDLVGWKSVNNADLYWNNAASGLFNLNFRAKTNGVNINPANDNEKIGVLYQFFAGTTLLAERLVELDQSVASTDWKDYSVPQDIGATEPDGVFLTIMMGKNATGMAWFDNVDCGTDPWTMGVFNADAETPVGWMMWASTDEVGFANTVQGEAHSGAWSTLLLERDNKADEMVFYSEPAPAEPDKWYMVSVWAKTDSVNDSLCYVPTNLTTERLDDRLGLCFFFHKGLKTSWDLTPPGDMYIYFDQTKSATDWTQYVVAVKAPAEEVAGLSVRARFTSFPVGYCWYDDFEARPFDIVMSVEEPIKTLPGQLPDRFALVQNYPNPFNPGTTIEYNLPEDGAATLTIYNLLGQRVRTLVDKFHMAGSYKVAWDGLGDTGTILPGGIYIIRLQGKDVLLSRKMMLLK